MEYFQKQSIQNLKGLRNGLQYGTKVRFVHSLIMTLLFKDINRQNLSKNLKNVIQNTLQHGKNLGSFVFLYKSTYKILDKLLGKKNIHHFVSGCIFGAVIFGKNSVVNQQIVLYLLSRVIVGLLTLIYKKLQQIGVQQWNFIKKGYGYYLLSSICWGIVMWLFERDRHVLQPGLRSSMVFLYKDSDHVESLTELIPFYPKKNEISNKKQ